MQAISIMITVPSLGSWYSQREEIWTPKAFSHFTHTCVSETRATSIRRRSDADVLLTISLLTSADVQLTWTAGDRQADFDIC